MVGFKHQSTLLPFKTKRPIVTSPLIESVCQLMLSVHRSPHLEKRYSWFEVTRLLVRAGRIDDDSLDCAIRLFLSEVGLNWPKFRPGTFIQWKRARKSVRKALQELARGENPEFSELIHKVKVLADKCPEYQGRFVDELDVRRELQEAAPSSIPLRQMAESVSSLVWEIDGATGEGSDGGESGEGSEVDEESEEEGEEVEERGAPRSVVEIRRLLDNIRPNLKAWIGRK
jgi:hypothetical protein